MGNSKKITIQKDSQLISIYASGKLTATQKKIYNFFIYNAKQILSNQDEYIFIIQMQDLLNSISENQLNYEQIKENIKALRDVKIEFNILKKNQQVIWEDFSLLAGVTIKNGSIEYSFPHQVWRYIKTPHTYAYLDLKIMKELESKHSISMYEILQDYKNLKNIEIDFNNFKKAMDIDETQYQRFNTFREKVLDVAINEINKKTDLHIFYEKITKGRKVTGLKFIINETIEKQEQEDKITNRQSFINFIRKEKVNVSMITANDGFNGVMEIACSAKGLLYDKRSAISFDKERADRIWSKLYELYQEEKMPWQKETHQQH